MAAGSWRRGESGFLSVGIITHPAHRGKGHAKKVVNALTQRGLTNGATMHYQTLEFNTPSVAIAQSLGYKRLGRTIAIRLSIENIDATYIWRCMNEDKTSKKRRISFH